MKPTRPAEEEELYPAPQDEAQSEEQFDAAPVNFDDDGEDPLKRHTKFSWKSFGGDGFIVSVVFHAILIIFALFYVVATIEPEEPEPTEFVSGAGGGGGGENPNRQQHRMRPKPRDMSMQNKITSKSTRSTLTLPEMPKVNSMMGSMGGMKAGGASSGLGSGAGGGIGSGMGPGIGNGRAFLSKFGSANPNMGGIVGQFYDLKLTADGADTDMKPKNQESMAQYLKIGRSIVRTKGQWSTTPLKRYFKADTRLSAPAQIFIPGSNADDAPKAFGLKNQGQRWYIHYKGNVRPNKTGKIRLLGNADDLICVRFGNALVLDSGWDLMSVDVGQAKGQNVKRVLGVDEMRAPIPGFGANLKVRVGPAFDVRSGTTYPFECLIGETPGGNFSAILLFEELDRQGKPVGKPKLFRLSPEPLADTLVDEIRKNPNWGKWNQMFDLNGGGWDFYPVKGRR